MSNLLQEQVYRTEFPDLKGAERYLLAYMAFRANDDGTAIYPNIDTISIAMRLSRRWVRRLIDGLQEKGYLLRVSSGIGRGQRPGWHIPLDAKGRIAPRPLAGAPAEKKLKLVPRQPTAPAEEDENFIDEMSESFDQAPEPPVVRHLPAVQGSQALIPVEALQPGDIDSELAQYFDLWFELVDLGQQIPLDAPNRGWYQRKILAARDQLNDELSKRGITTINEIDGFNLEQPEPLDDEMEEQLEELFHRARRHEHNASLYAPDSPNWRKWNSRAAEARSIFYSLLTRKRGIG